MGFGGGKEGFCCGVSVSRGIWHCCIALLYCNFINQLYKKISVISCSVLSTSCVLLIFSFLIIQTTLLNSKKCRLLYFAWCFAVVDVPVSRTCFVLPGSPFIALSAAKGHRHATQSLPRCVSGGLMPTRKAII
ncbi:MAG: hypothetical protein JWQ09_5602 [Segetibacter sp.]|nr:hypothetical protein [Segetibacter sp.]